jgi:hypothetical protein
MSTSLVPNEFDHDCLVVQVLALCGADAAVVYGRFSSKASPSVLSRYPGGLRSHTLLLTKPIPNAAHLHCHSPRRIRRPGRSLWRRHRARRALPRHDQQPDNMDSSHHSARLLIPSLSACRRRDVYHPSSSCVRLLPQRQVCERCANVVRRIIIFLVRSPTTPQLWIELLVTFILAILWMVVGLRVVTLGLNNISCDYYKQSASPSPEQGQTRLLTREDDQCGQSTSTSIMWQPPAARLKF